MYEEQQATAMVDRLILWLKMGASHCVCVIFALFRFHLIMVLFSFFMQLEMINNIFSWKEKTALAACWHWYWTSL